VRGRRRRLLQQHQLQLLLVLSSPSWMLLTFHSGASWSRERFNWTASPLMFGVWVIEDEDTTLRSGRRGGGTGKKNKTNKQTNKQKTLHFAFSSGTYLTSQWRQTAQCTWSSDWSQWVLVWYHLLHIFIWLQFITLHHKIENSKSLLIYKVITGILQCISCVYILSKYFRILTTVPELISSDMM